MTTVTRTVTLPFDQTVVVEALVDDEIEVRSEGGEVTVTVTPLAELRYTQIRNSWRPDWGTDNP